MIVTLMILIEDIVHLKGLRRLSPITPIQFKSTSTLNFRELLLGQSRLKEESYPEVENDKSKQIWDIKKELHRKSSSEIVRMIRHELLWIKQNWKWHNSEDADMQVDGNPDDQVCFKIEKDKYYDLMHSLMLSRRRGEKHTINQR